MIEEYSLPFRWTQPPAADRASDAAAPALVAPDVAAVVQTHAALLFRVAHAVLRSRAEAEDCVQDSFVRVLENADKLPGIRDLRPWLVRIAWNLALDRRRRIRPEQMDPLFAASLLSRSLSAEQCLLETRRHAAVLAAIDRLPKAERQALLLTALDELSPAEVSAVLGKSPSAVRALLFRARTHLRDRLTAAGHL